MEANGEKPSKYTQWLERSDRPTTSREMTRTEIEEHRINLVRSYHCSDADVIYDIERIIDEEDEDRDKCLWLRYKIKCLDGGTREIFSIKILVPEELKRVAENMRKQQADKQSQRKQLADASAPPAPPEPPGPPVINPRPPSKPSGGRGRAKKS